MKKYSSFFDNLFWFLIYSLPLIVYLFSLIRIGAGSPTLSEIFNDFAIIPTDIVGSVLLQVFGETGVLPLAGVASVVPFASYLFSVTVIHLIVDILLCIPRFAHCCVDKLFKKEVK